MENAPKERNNKKENVKNMHWPKVVGKNRIKKYGSALNSLALSLHSAAAAMQFSLLICHCGGDIIHFLCAFYYK